MDVLERRVRVKSLADPFVLHAISDTHLMARGCDEERLRRHVLDISREENSCVILGGDLVDCVAHDDKRFSPSSFRDAIQLRDLSDLLEYARDLVGDVFAPVGGRIIASITGNHEEAYAARHHVNVTAQLAEVLDCPGLGYSAFVKIRFVCGNETIPFMIATTHGSGAATSPGGKLNRLIATMKIFDADLILMGHVHESIAMQSSTLELDPGGIGDRTKTGVITGTYLRTYTMGYSSYGERAGYAPTRLGHPRIEITPATGKISVGWV